MSQQAHGILSRRIFLKTALAGVVLLGSRLAVPNSANGHAHPEGKLRLYNVNTKERLVVTYRNRTGQYDQEALNALNHFLRCPHSESNL